MGDVTGDVKAHILLLCALYANEADRLTSQMQISAPAT